MTHPARITQADMERAIKSVKAAGFKKARIVMNLEARTIEIIVDEGGEPTCGIQAGREPNEWDNE